MRARLWREIAGTMLAAALSFNTPGASAAPVVDAPRPALDGTFLQLLAEHGNWQRADWERLFSYFRAMKLRRLVVQWSVHDSLRFYPTAQPSSLKQPPLETILELADAAGMQVFVGLAHEGRFWTEIAAEPSAAEKYLDGLRGRSIATATELLPVVGRFASFSGWYIPEEIDDINWRESSRRKVLFAHVSKLASELKALSPSARVGISGFSNARLDPASFSLLWSTLLDAAPGVDTVFFQDGIGTQKLGIPEMAIYVDAIADAVVANQRELAVIVEVFRQVAGPPIDSRPFAAVPAPLERIREQISIAQRRAGSVIAFSIPEYLTPMGGADAGRLYESYLDELTKPGPQRAAPEASSGTAQAE